jgi:hypothetical protein
MRTPAHRRRAPQLSTAGADSFVNVTHTPGTRFGAREPRLWVRRATRSSISIPIAYRRVAHDQWFRGELVNISRTGALFIADQALVPEAQAALVIFLSRAALAATGGRGPWPDGYSRGLVTRMRQLTNGRHVAAVRFDADWTSAPPDVET